MTDATCRLAYGGLSTREAPPYSPNVDLRAYIEFWTRLRVSNCNASMIGYMATGSGSVQSTARSGASEPFALEQTGDFSKRVDIQRHRPRLPGVSRRVRSRVSPHAE